MSRVHARPLVRLAALAWLGLAVLVAAPAHAAVSPAGYAADLLSLVNQARQSNGLAPVTAAEGTWQVAQAWTEHLAAAGALSHNPDLGEQLSTHGSPDWRDCGEVVGTGPADDPQALFDGYMNSSVHRAVLLDPAVRFIGVGVVDSGDAAFNTMDVVDSYGSQPAAVAAPPAAPVAPAAPGPAATAAPPPAGAGTAAFAPAAPAPPTRPAGRAPPRPTAVPSREVATLLAARSARSGPGRVGGPRSRSGAPVPAGSGWWAPFVDAVAAAACFGCGVGTVGASLRARHAGPARLPRRAGTFRAGPAL